VKTYQAMFIFSSSLADEALQEVLQSVQGEVEKLGGTVTGSDIMGKRVFARPMKKMETGQYAKMLIQMLPSSVSPLLARMKLNEKIFRVQIVEMKPAKATPSPEAPAAVPSKEGAADGQPK